MNLPLEKQCLTNPEFYQFINDEVLPNTSLNSVHFWADLNCLINDFSHQNTALLNTRRQMQQKIDQWHRENTLANNISPEHSKKAYQAFLQSIGYLTPMVDDFTIETDERIPSHIILLKALGIFKNNITNFMDMIKDTEEVEIYNSDCIMNSYDVAIKDEDYTLGYLLQYYIYKLYKNVENPVVNYIASNVPHPLESKLVFRIGMVESSTKKEAIKTLIINTCEVIKKDISKFESQVSSQKL